MDSESTRPTLTRRFPLAMGLRAQIVMALAVIFALSFALLAAAAVALSGRASERDAERAIALAGRGLALYLDESAAVTGRKGRPRKGLALNRAVDGLLGGFPGSAVRIEWPDGSTYRRGVIPARPGTRFELGSGGRIHLWLSYSPSTMRSPVSRLLLFYVALTGAVVMLFTYVALTYWIVGPVEKLIRWTEKLASGDRKTGAPLQGAAEVMRLAIAFSDMAAQLSDERLALEQRLRELEQTTGELKSAEQQLVHGERLATVGRLAAGVAHEIGNPLAAILGLVELLKQGGLQEGEQEEFLQRIHAETQRIHRIIRDLLDFSRRGVESEELGMTSHLRRAIEDAVNLVKPVKELRDVTIELRCPDDLPRVVGPQHRLTQVLLNLLLNAADSLQGKGSIGIDVEHQSQAGFIAVSVSDNGPGISDQIMDGLFEPFTTTKPPGKGTGLGLAVSHTLIESLGGSLSASNPSKGGARFEVRLRISAASSSRPPSRPSSRPPSA